ncbi:type II secretion system F family protein [Gracilibacillus salinarum]|uniref:Type II secretion system F family protein n=1 Tax=Gracilibacillus salinarum TaxID=2932255 RepID=A0ABY4GHE4_9BACI|nr:type II secretion system F family protein [Gracilibacillus salinarum]UOQ83634.1 type II secretion system F family protein [Gracilibacillus salinarum]
MDGLIVLFLLLTLFFTGLALRYTYVYVVYKSELKKQAKEDHYKEDIFEKKQTRKEKVLSKVFHYADDFSTIGQRINFYSEDHDVEKWLTEAGHPYRLTTARLQGLKIFFMIVGLIIGGISMILRLPFSELTVIIYPIVGYLAVVFWIKSKAKKRQEELTYQLPDFLDTMSVTLKAGVSLDQALRDIVPYFEGPVQEEFGRFIQEIQVGVPRSSAYEMLLKRNTSKEFQLLIKALIQGEKLGIPISKTFHQQSLEMRKIKKELIKEQAAKASPKVTLITTFVVLPSALVLIGGLMVMNMFSQNSNIFELFQ